jgi:DNA-binding CsgD family transcriptional regulator
LLSEGRLGVARSELEGLLRRADEEGDEYARIIILQLLSHLEWCAGRPTQAAALAVDALAGDDPTQYASLHRKARAEATLGDLATARHDAENARELAEGAKDAIHAAHAHAVLGFLELSSGDAEAADRLADLADRLLAMGLGEPAIFPFFPDAIEALVGVGDLERAEALLGWLEERGRSLDRTWALAAGARCRGLVASAKGDQVAALAAFDDSLAHHARLPFPFERGRTLLALGQTRRRGKQKRAAREALAAALAIFEEVGAPLWAEKARAELARIGGRTASAGDLTPTEQRVAELVAEGRSNKEVAGELFVTVKTVERNLSRVYEKLGVRSRSELARRFAADEAGRTQS